MEPNKKNNGKEGKTKQFGSRNNNREKSDVNKETLDKVSNNVRFSLDASFDKPVLMPWWIVTKVRGQFVILYGL